MVLNCFWQSLKIWEPEIMTPNFVTSHLWWHHKTPWFCVLLTLIPAEISLYRKVNLAKLTVHLHWYKLTYFRVFIRKGCSLGTLSTKEWDQKGPCCPSFRNVFRRTEGFPTYLQLCFQQFWIIVDPIVRSIGKGLDPAGILMSLCQEQFWFRQQIWPKRYLSS